MEELTAAEIHRIDDQTVEALLQRALDPQVPVALFYAVLDQLARSAPCDPQPVEVAAGTDHGEPPVPPGQSAAAAGR